MAASGGGSNTPQTAGFPWTSRLPSPVPLGKSLARWVGFGESEMRRSCSCIVIDHSHCTSTSSNSSLQTLDNEAERC